MRRELLVALLACSGCYVGLDPEPPAGGDDGVSTGGGSDGSDDPAERTTETGGADTGPEVGDCVALPPNLRRLTAPQYDNTVAELVPGIEAPSDGFVGSLTLPDPLSGDTESLALSTPHVAQLRTVAESIGVQLAAAPGSVANCMPAAGAEAECVEEFVQALLRRAFRRDANDEETTSYVEFFDEQRDAYGVEDALQMTTQRVLLAPDFLFRTELGDGSDDTMLTPHERASQISYTLSDAPPDPELAAAADDETLLDPEVARAHIERLLSYRVTSAGLMRFMEAHTRYSDVAGAVKDPAVFPEFDPELASDMADGTEEFIAHLLWGGDGRLGSLFTADFVAVNDRLAALYGIEGEFGAEFSIVPAPPSRRGGLLTHSSLLATHSTEKETSIVTRGLHVAEQLLCLQLEDPPPGVPDNVPEIDESDPLTQRDRLEMHRVDPNCAICHDHMDPLGYPLEAYDAIGGYRETDDGGLTPDLRMTMPVSLDPDKSTVANVEELGGVIATLDRNYDCFVDHLYRYTAGPAPASDSCEVEDYQAALRESDGEIIPLLTLLLTSENATRRVRQ